MAEYPHEITCCEACREKEYWMRIYAEIDAREALKQTSKKVE